MNKSYLYIILFALLCFGCRPEAEWSDDSDTEIEMQANTISAGYIECTFSTDHDAYYLISIEPARAGYDPMAHQKQFMMLALDSANVAYLSWRNKLLRAGQTTIAPFSSHCLQYGTTQHFFTGLTPDSDYWVFAFLVNPDTMKPIGKLNLYPIHTAAQSVVDIHFEYRVDGTWDYIYPVDSFGIINSHFPYLATTRDSLEIEGDGYSAVRQYFYSWVTAQFNSPERARVFYGVQVIENDGLQSHLVFEQGHTYFTAIFGFDGTLKHGVIYRFRWEGETTQYFFAESDSANIFRSNSYLPTHF